jgi:hypothetical protein
MTSPAELGPPEKTDWPIVAATAAAAAGVVGLFFWALRAAGRAVDMVRR